MAAEPARASEAIKKNKELAARELDKVKVSREENRSAAGRISEAKTGVNLPPIHPNDRCTIMPKIPGTAPTGVRTARDPKTGRNYKVPAGMSYKEWRKSISEKYGADTIETAQKKYWNRKADAAQLKRMQEVLGKHSGRGASACRKRSSCGWVFSL